LFKREEELRGGVGVGWRYGRRGEESGGEALLKCMVV